MSRPRAGLVAAAAAGIVLCAMLAVPYLPAILGATLLAIAFDPLHQRLARVVRNRSFAALLSTVAVVILVLVPAVALSSAAVGELRELYRQLSAANRDHGGLAALLQERLAPALDWLAERSGIASDELRAALVERIAQAGGAVLRSTRALASALTEGVVQLVVGMMTLFFLLRDGRTILAHAASAIPLPPDQVKDLFEHAGGTIVANMYGVLAVALAQGLLAGLGFYFVGLPSPVLWGLVAGLFSLVPIVGTGIVWVPAVILLTAGGNWGRALLLAAWSAGIVAMADNFVRPWVVGQRMNSHPLLVFFALLGGVKLFGIAGLFVGPMILSVTAVLIRFATKPVTEGATEEQA